MIGMSTYIWRIISLLLLLCLPCFSLSAEENKDEDKKAEKIFFYGVYVDYDLGDLLMSAINSQRFGTNASIEVDLMHLLYPAFEFGYEEYDSAPDYCYNNTSGNEQTQGVTNDIKGIYYKLGVNINLLKKDYSKKLTPYGFLGFRYAVAPHYSYDIAGFALNSSYWPLDDSNGSDRIEWLSGNSKAHWMEFIAGVSTPIYKGFCMGAELRFKQFLSIRDVKDENNLYLISPSYAPGYGDKEDGKWGFRYTISYFFH